MKLFGLLKYLWVACLPTSDWEYTDTHRYSPSTGQVQLLDVDGWCNPMNAKDARRIYGVEDQEIRIKRTRIEVLKKLGRIDV